MSIRALIATQFDATGLKRAEKSFANLGKQIRSSVGVLGAGFGLAAITKQLMDASKAAVEETKSQALLANQLKNTLGATDSAIASSEDFIKSLMLQTSIADDQLRPALAKLAVATGDVTSAQTLLKLATDISAAGYGNLESVSKALGKAATGNTTALFRLIPSLKGSSDWAKQAALEFGGMAEAAANNDPFQRLNVIFGEVSEQIGMSLLPELNKLADYFASPEGQKQLQNYAVLFMDLAKVFIFVGTTIAEFLAGFRVVGTAFGKLFDGDIKGFLDLMNSRGMVDALGKLESLNSTPKTKTNIFAGASGLPSATTNKKSAAQVAAEKAASALKSFQTALKDLKLEPLKFIDREIGQFEQSVIDSFDAIAKKLQDGIANKTIAKKGGQALLSYVAVERKALEALAQQRDALVAKRGLAETLIADVKSALTGVGSLAGLLETETKSVTTSVSQIVDGFVVTTKRTVDEVVGGKGVISRLKEVVAKTKAFAAQLTDLKAMGLNPDLFKQIVDAGPDVGSQLAKEILDGGTDSVSALNTTFAELQTVAGQVAEQTAVVMYNNGVDVAGGLVAGLLSQEQALVDAANQLAAAFNAAYQSQIMSLSVPSAPKVAPKANGKTVVNNQTINLTTTRATKSDAQNLIAAQKKFYGSNYAANITGRSIFV